MDSTTTKTVKPLRELLKQQQEPFILEAYLLERGYLRKSSNAEDNNSCYHGNSSKFLKRPGSCRLNKSKKGFLHYTKLLKAVYNKVISVNELLRIRNCEDKDEKSIVTETCRNCQEAAEPDRFSSASGTTVYNSCTESDAEETSTSWQKDCTSFTAETSQSVKLSNPRGAEAPTERNLRWRCTDDSKQHSTVSVLEDLSSRTGAQEALITRQGVNPSRTRVTSTKKITDDSILSASLWKLLLHSATEKQSCAGTTELQELVQSTRSPYLKSKRILQQTKQLLFDCVREAVKIHGREERRQQHCNEFLGSKELGNFICEKIKVWGKHSGNESNVTQLFDSEFMDPAQEWYEFEAQKKEIALDIGDAILEEIEKEIVAEFILFSDQSQC